MAREAWTTDIRDTPDPAGYQVDDLTIDLGPRRVRRAATVIPLKALSFDLLVTLVRAAPDLVSFDQLSERVWPGLVVTPETIVQRVKLLRSALGDDPHAPRCGYPFQIGLTIKVPPAIPAPARMGRRSTVGADEPETLAPTLQCTTDSRPDDTMAQPECSAKV